MEEAAIMNTLYVCENNLVKSQIAYALHWNHFGGRNVDSAGVNVDGQEGAHVSNDLCEIMKEVGVEINGQRAKQLTEYMVSSASRVIVLCPKEICPKYLTGARDADVIYWNISDLISHEMEELRKTRDEIIKYFSS